MTSPFNLLKPYTIDTTQRFTFANVDVTGNLSATNANLGNVASANYFIGNGAYLTGLPAGYTDSNVTTLLASFGSNSISTTGNITAGNLTTSGSSGNITGANVISANTFIGDGSQLTGLPASYADSNVQSYLPTYTGNLSPGNLVVATSANLGNVGNVHISGGSNGQVLTTNGSGSLSWQTVSSGSALEVTVDDFTGDDTTTTFSLSATPSNINFTLASIAGVLQPRTAYTVSGSSLTFSSAPPSTAPVEITTFTSTGSGGGGGGLAGYTYSSITSNTTAAANTKYIVNTNSANITITLPSSATLGTEVGIIDGTGNASTHAITIYGNGSNIQGQSSNMTVTTNRAAFTLVYYNSTQGWILTNV